MEIIVEDFSDLVPNIRKLLKDEVLPEIVINRLNKQKLLLRRVIKLIEKNSKVPYPRIYVKPYAYITPVEWRPATLRDDTSVIGYWDPFVSFALTFIKKINNRFEIVVGISAATLLLASEQELKGILGHEFLHYAFKVFIYLVWRDEDSPLRNKLLLKLIKREKDIDSMISNDKVSYNELVKKVDEGVLEKPELFFKMSNISKCINMMKPESKEARLLIKKIINEWFSNNLPCLPSEIELLEIDRELKQNCFELEKLNINPEMIKRIKKVKNVRVNLYK